jgi:hypothetical protein
MTSAKPVTLPRRPSSLVSLLGVLVGALAGGCPDPAPAPDAGGQDAAISHEPRPPAPPAAPALPVLTPCPPGWRERAVGPATVCEPFGDETTPRCGADELVVQGRAAGAACEPALACPAGDWPDDAPLDAIHARAGASGGDGSRARPFGTLAEALSAAEASGRPVVLGEGELVGGVQVRGVSISGLCPERTRIVDPSTSMSAPLIVRAGTVTLRGLHLEGALYGLWLTNGADVTAVGVTATGASSAIRLDGGAVLDATRVRAESPRTNELEDPTLRLGPDAVATLHESTLVGGGSIAYGYKRASDPSDVRATLTIEGSTLLDAPVGIAGRLDTTLRRVAIDGVGVGIVTISPRVAVLEDVAARQVAGVVTADSAFVNGVGGTTTLTRVSLVGVQRGAALLALGSLSPDATVVGRDLVVADVGGDVAAHAEVGGTLELSRVLFTGLAGTGIQAAGAAHVALEDATILATGPGADGTFGSAIDGSGEGTTISVARLRASPVGHGLAFLDGATATADDVAIEGGLGIGVQCDPGAGCADAPPLLTLTRARVTGTARYGLAVIGANVRADDLDVDGITVPDASLVPGIGVLAAFGGGLVGGRIRVQAVAGLGALSLRGSVLELHDLEVGGTVLRTCPECGAATFGDGVACAESGVLRASDFRIHGSARAGLAAALGCAPPTFGVGVVEGNGVGILTDTSVDATLFRTLLVRGNGTDYDRTDLSLGASEVGLSDSSL